MLSRLRALQRLQPAAVTEATQQYLTSASRASASQPSGNQRSGPLSAYNVFFKERVTGHKGPIDFRALAEEWRSLDAAAKQPYQRAAAKANAQRPQQGGQAPAAAKSSNKATTAMRSTPKVPHAPTAYNLFVAERAPKLPGTGVERMRAVAAEWQALDAVTKEHFQRAAAEKKESRASQHAAAKD